jgi:hypothetical protein
MQPIERCANRERRVTAALVAIARLPNQVRTIHEEE